MRIWTQTTPVREEWNNQDARAGTQRTSSIWVCIAYWPRMEKPKKRGTLRFFADCWNLNPVTVRYSYPIPPMNECIDSLRGAMLFSTLDANSGYCQAWISKRERKKPICRAIMDYFGLFVCCMDWKIHWAHFNVQWRSICLWSIGTSR